MRQSVTKRRGYLVHFEPRMSQTAAKADEWIPVRPGTEGLVALAIGRLAAEARGNTLPQAFAGVNVEDAASASGISVETLEHLADLFSRAKHPLAIPGGAALGHNHGLEAAEAVLALNTLVGNLGQPGGVYLSALSPLEDEYHRPANLKEMAAFIGKMNSGQVKVLFVHGVNPIFELPKSLGFEDAMKNVPLVISFATFPDETAMQADYIFPDHHGLESWGYQRVVTGAAQSTLWVVSSMRPRSTASLPISSSMAAGGRLPGVWNLLPRRTY
jgi:anaerobic selenocysteine-containing dehydrogenase